MLLSYLTIQMAGFDIRELRQNQAQKFANEKKAIEDKIKLEQEENMLKEITFKNNFENYINRLTIILINIQSCHDILELNIYVESFKHVLENEIEFTNTEYCHQEISNKVIELINCVSQNENTKFNVTVKNPNTEAAQNIMNNIKIIMELIKLHENDVHIEVMDTTGDEELAKKLHNKYDDQINQNVNNDPIFVPTKTNPIHNSVPEYFSGFDQIDDPELIQLLHFQNELMDD